MTDPHVAQGSGAGEPIYLDHNATTPVDPAALSAMLPYLYEHFGNPSSTHPYGRRAAEAVTTAREQVAASIGAQAAEIVFTSGGTESNNLAIRGIAATAAPERRRIVTSDLEHPATTAPLRHLQDSGWTVDRLPCGAAGVPDLSTSRDIWDQRVALVTVMLAQNETGAVLPVAELATRARTVGAIVHTDAAQAIGKIAVDVNDLGVDLLTIAGHKVYAPKGVGALYLRRGTNIAPVLLGAGQEHGLRPGTENVAGVVALGAACEWARALLDTESLRQRELRDDLWRRLHGSIPAMTCHTPDNGLSNTLLVSFPGVLGRDVLAQAPQVAASTGSACHSGVDTASASLLASGLTTQQALGAVRLTIGRATTTEQIAAAAEHLVQAYGRCAASR